MIQYNTIYRLNVFLFSVFVGLIFFLLRVSHWPIWAKTISILLFGLVAWKVPTIDPFSQPYAPNESLWNILDHLDLFIWKATWLGFLLGVRDYIDYIDIPMTNVSTKPVVKWRMMPGSGTSFHRNLSSLSFFAKCNLYDRHHLTAGVCCIHLDTPWHASGHRLASPGLPKTSALFSVAQCAA